MPTSRLRPRPPLPHLALVALTIACTLATLAAPAAASGPSVRVVGRAHRLVAARHGLAVGTGPLVDHGGAVLADARVHTLWWGRPSSFAPDERDAVASFLAALDGSRHLGLLGPYLRGATPHVRVGATLVDPSSPPRTVTPTVLGTEIARRTAGRVDPHDVFLVLTADPPSGAGFCGWHDAVAIDGTVIAVVYLPGYGEGSPCDAGDRVGANGLTPRSRLVVNVAAHELFETMTDAVPGLRTGAWTDRAGLEIGDKCAWQFVAPVRLRDATRWQLQTEWSNTTARCEQGA